MPATQWISVYSARRPMKQSVGYCSNLWALIMDAGTGFTTQKPLDVSAAVKMLVYKANLKGSSLPEDYLAQSYNDCFKDSTSSYHEKESLGYNFDNCTTERSKYYKIAESNVGEGIEDPQDVANPITDSGQYPMTGSAQNF
ncbi:hypothetical protein KIW84_074393 [Lathyrus oleraceus]|uniref:Uncharacterized protein n=1 Tax=Pisum sativum TaxID=3888 RepID=A0A9D4ZYI6_PEA|nr:hypothetical protein KIW84_074393 [Pisum sativum]